MRKREKDKLERTLGGIRDMARVPSAVWICDTKKEHIAVNEARKLSIPVVAILDTNCDPDEVDYPIPGNDDAIRSVSLLTRVVADAVADGLMARAGAAPSGDEKPAAWCRRAAGRVGARAAGEQDRGARPCRPKPETAARPRPRPPRPQEAPAAEAPATRPPAAEAPAAEAPAAEAPAAEAARAEARHRPRQRPAPAETAAPRPGRLNGNDDRRRERQTNNGELHRRRRQAAPGPHRLRHDGLQEGS